MINMEEHIAEIDPSLKEELRYRKIVPIIIEFFEAPKDEQIERLKDMGIKIDNVFKVSPLASGTANSEQIEKIRRLSCVKKVWLDSEVRVLRTSKDDYYLSNCNTGFH